MIKHSRSTFLKSLTTVSLGSFLLPNSAQAKDDIPTTCFSEKDYPLGNLLYENSLAGPDDVKNFTLEGEAKISFPNVVICYLPIARYYIDREAIIIAKPII